MLTTTGLGQLQDALHSLTEPPTFDEMSWREAMRDYVVHLAAAISVGDMNSVEVISRSILEFNIELNSRAREHNCPVTGVRWDIPPYNFE